MNIAFYKISDDNTKVYKDISNPMIVQGTCRAELDLFSPEVILETDVSDYNYMYLEDFDRYYYINGCTIVNNGLYKVKDVREDVLMSLKGQFLQLTAIIDKSELKNLGDEYIDDGSFITQAKTFDKVYNFPSGFNDTPDFILVTAGGDYNS